MMIRGQRDMEKRWYVVHTMKGQETKYLDGIREYVTDEADEAFMMINEKQYKHQGRWEAERENLFPGYLFVATDQPEDFDRRLRKKYHPLKLLTFDDEIKAIRPEEQAFLRRLGGEDHIVRYSEGFKDGDQIVVESGSLKGLSGEIRKVDRHNRQAVITVSLFGRETNVTLGLGIVKSV